MLKNENNAKAILRDTFGFDSFRPLQEAIINSVIQGENHFVLMPTGGGKSLCYQIPALVRDGTAIIVSPLISLMHDQVQALRANGVAAHYLNSSLTSSEQQQILKEFQRGELKLLYIAPERLMTDYFLSLLHVLDISLFAIDEAHCISQWGPDFRPEYQQLKQIRELFPDIPLIALTATADKVTREDIIQQLKLQDSKITISSFNRPNIRYTVIEKHNPFLQITTFLKNHQNESGIVYCLTRKRVENLAEKLKEAGYKVAAYHGGMETAKRNNTQTQFQRDNIDIVVATVAFGMGIDKPNVRFVIHYDIPKNIEAYYQETGRAGRDGLAAEALLLYGLQDVVQVKLLIENTLNTDLKRIESHKLNAMTQFAEAQICRRKVLLNYFNEDLNENCNNCDICLSPPQCYDATVDAQKAISCIYRANQGFGINHIVDILRGAENARIKQWGHQRLSTYGIGKEQSSKAWFSIIRQLIHHGLVEQDLKNYSVLKITEKGFLFLRHKESIELAKPRIINKEKTKAAKTKKTELVHGSYDTELFEKLRKLRKKIAEETNVAPFIVFSDVSLEKHPLKHQP